MVTETVEEDEQMIWLVGWEYGDHSGGEFVRAFDSEETATKCFELLKKHGDGSKQYYCKAIPFDQEY